MKKTILIGLCMMILLAFNVNAEWQNNKSFDDNECYTPDGLDAWNDRLNACDGNWGTYAIKPFAPDSLLCVNVTITEGGISNATINILSGDTGGRRVVCKNWSVSSRTPLNNHIDLTGMITSNTNNISLPKECINGTNLVIQACLRRDNGGVRYYESFLNYNITMGTNSMNISTTPYPTNTSFLQFNDNTVNFNVSVNSSYDFNCRLYINESLINTSNYIAGQNIFVNFSQNIQNGYSNYFLYCFNNETIETTSTNLFLVDTINPVIDVGSNLSSNTSSVFFGNLYQVSVNVTDNNLWGLNITLENGNVLFNKTGIGTTRYDYNLSFDPRDYSLSIGVHTIIVEISDSHTANVIPDYLVSKNPLSKAITYSFGKDWIRVKPSETLSIFDTRKSIDRYSFELTRNFLSKFYDTIEFDVTSNTDLTIVKDSQYKGHIISNSLKKWIDFESIYDDIEVTTKQISPGHIRVFLSGVSGKNLLNFNSIGGLNLINKTYRFYYGNITETFINQTLEGETNTFTLNFTKNATFVGDITANITWNGSVYVPTKSSTANYIYFTRDITLNMSGNRTFAFNWSYYVTTSGEFNRTNTSNQTSYKMILSNCTIGSPSINFSTIDEITNVAVSTVKDALFTVWNSTKTKNRSYSFHYAAAPSDRFCLYPSWATVHSNIEVELTATNYGLREFIKSGYELRANFTNITVYMTPTTNITEITYTIVNEDDSELVGYSVEAWRYNLATNDYTLIDTRTTDSDGAVVFNLDIVNKEYRINIYNGAGTLVHTEPKQLLTLTSYTIRVFLTTPPTNVLLRLKNLDFTLKANRTNNNFSLVYDDSATGLISFANFTVFKQNATNITLLYSASSAATSGTMWYNVSNNGHYFATFIVRSTDDGNLYTLDTKTLDLREEYTVFGDESLFMAWFFIGTLAFTGVFMGAEICLILTIVGLVVFWKLGFIILSLASLMGVVASAILLLIKVSRK